MAAGKPQDFQRNILFTWNKTVGFPNFARWSYHHNFVTPPNPNLSKQLMLHHRSMMQHPNNTMIEAKRRGPDAQSSGQTIPSRATSMSLCWTWTSGIIFSSGASWRCQTWTKLADSMRNGPIYWVYWGESQHKVGTESKDLPNTYGPLLESLVECGGDMWRYSFLLPQKRNWSF